MAAELSAGVVEVGSESIETGKIAEAEVALEKPVDVVEGQVEEAAKPSGFGSALSAFQARAQEEEKDKVVGRVRDADGKFLDPTVAKQGVTERIPKGEDLKVAASGDTNVQTPVPAAVAPVANGQPAASSAGATLVQEPPKMPKGPEAYFVVPPPKDEDFVPYEKSAPFTAVGEDFDVPKEDVIATDTRMTAKRPKVRIIDDFVETDLYGRGFPGAFPGVKDPEKMIEDMATAKLKKQGEIEHPNLAGSFVSYDNYGRADPRIFSTGAEIASKEQAKVLMMQKRTEALSKKKVMHIAPAHPRLVGNAAVTKAEEQRVQKVVDDILSKKETLRKEQLETRRRIRELELQKIADKEKEEELQARARTIKSTDEFKTYFAAYEPIPEPSEEMERAAAKAQASRGIAVTDQTVEATAGGVVESEAPKASALAAKFEQLDVSEGTAATKKMDGVDMPVVASPEEKPLGAAALAARFEQSDTGAFTKPEETEKPEVAVSADKPSEEEAPPAATGGVSSLLSRFQQAESDAPPPMPIAPKSAVDTKPAAIDEAVPDAKIVSTSAAEEVAEQATDSAAAVADGAGEVAESTAEEAESAADETVAAVESAAAAVAKPVKKKVVKKKTTAGTPSDSADEGALSPSEAPAKVKSPTKVVKKKVPKPKPAAEPELA